MVNWLLFNPLKYFVETARTGSIKAASERLNVAASAISRHIQIFEADAAAPLFERHARGMGLTAAGEIYMRYAQSVLAEAENTQLQIDALKGLKRGHIRICCVEGVVAGPLAEALAAFKRDYPEISYNVRAASTASVMQVVRDGEADVGVAFQSSPVGGVYVQRRIVDPLRAILKPGHPLCSKTELVLKDLADHPIAMPDWTFGIRQVMDAACHVHQQRLNIGLETNSIEALRSFARTGAGITVLPSLAAKSDLVRGDSVAIPIREDILEQSSMDIVVREGRKLTTLIQEFLGYMSVSFKPIM
jgi:DNA-binding transcriptional LysR family regulator